MSFADWKRDIVVTDNITVWYWRGGMFLLGLALGIGLALRFSK